MKKQSYDSLWMVDEGGMKVFPYDSKEIHSLNPVVIDVVVKVMAFYNFDVCCQWIFQLRCFVVIVCVLLAHCFRQVK